jgi:hypothetical protein
MWVGLEVCSPNRGEEANMNQEDPAEKSSLDRDDVMPIKHLKITLWVLLAVVIFSMWLVSYLLPA